MAEINEDTFSGPSFSIRNRLRRLVWQWTWQLLGRWSPRPAHGWRAMLLRGFGARVGRGVHVYPKVVIWAPWNVEIGDESSFADGVQVYSQGLVRLGKRVVISQGAYLCTGTHDYERSGSPLVTSPIEIGDYAWVAAEAFVHPGVRIGQGAVVGARSVVTKDMPEWMVCAGNPCRSIKERKWRPENPTP